MNNGKEIFQWHPAFYAAVQVELEEEKELLTFTNEYQLGTKPREVDVLIIKKGADTPLHKNIGKIFRKYNLIEYKSPTDYLSMDDFYKGLAYVCLYKSDTGGANAIDIDEITLTFAVSRFPREVLKYLNRREGHTVEKMENGIYYVRGSLVPIQIIVLNQLPAGKNLWLRVLTNNLREKNVARRMLTEYETHRNNALYSSVLDVVVKANEKVFKQEDNNMCELLEQIINEKMEKKLAAIEAAEAAARTAEANARATVEAAEAAARAAEANARATVEAAEAATRTAEANARATVEAAETAARAAEANARAAVEAAEANARATVEAAEAATRTAEANARAAVEAAEAATAEAAEKAEKALLKGRNEGMKQGRLQEQQHTAFNLKKINFSVEQIASVVEESVETVTAWLAEA